jgi:hypothetical protein
MTCEFEWQQGVVVMKRSNVRGAKAHSRQEKLSMERRVR